MKKKLALLNLFSVLFVIGVNYISQMYRLNNTTIGEISSRYDNLFTPAPYAFGIWSIIFLSLIGYAIFQVKRAFFSEKESNFITQTGYWFFVTNMLNAAWVLAFVFDYTGLSVLIMLGILFSLIKIILNTNMEKWDAPIEVIAFVWWPICVYSGWIAVATIANISAYLTKLGWDGSPLSEETWTIILISIATVINLAITWKRNMREFALVAVWAFIAIFVRHQENYKLVAYSALVAAIILFVSSMTHAIRNKETGPAQKLKERLQNH
ncbi:tryptophan-rich sensory protein [Zobellia amurskyensis]|uniref:Tryptophan-rich sensory protein n=1 Tax=Zobellia amurskyensis TaxID=248905 RepID=A0A7X2ZU96_9FLAO|nr:TspO/MBR family protein [Zobellia amurskyensis]MUH36497.1 tryptophan-rich sensory protein [Zobellia amurskyensis]